MRLHELLVLAVGQRQPAWADAAWADFAKRFPPELRLELKALKAEPRSGRKPPRRCMAAEAAAPGGGAAQGRAPRRARRARHAPDHARSWPSACSFWLGDGRDVALLIGGPDGLDPALKASADETLRLSDLTLPHAFARVLLAEALYRAWSRDRRPPVPPRMSPGPCTISSTSPRRARAGASCSTSSACATAAAARAPTRTPRRWRRYVPRRAAGRLRASASRAPSWRAARARLRSAACPPAPILCADTTVALGRASSASRPTRPRPRAMLARCRAARTAC